MNEAVGISKRISFTDLSKVSVPPKNIVYNIALGFRVLYLIYQEKTIFKIRNL